jgi:hypothetical protein
MYKKHKEMDEVYRKKTKLGYREDDDDERGLKYNK